MDLKSPLGRCWSATVLLVSILGLAPSCGSLRNARTADECRDRGGEWIAYACRQRMLDGGKPCAMGSDCESGVCLADEMAMLMSVDGYPCIGKCAPFAPPVLGCKTYFCAAAEELGPALWHFEEANEAAHTATSSIRWPRMVDVCID